MQYRLIFLRMRYFGILWETGKNLLSSTILIRSFSFTNVFLSILYPAEDYPVAATRSDLIQLGIVMRNYGNF